MATRAAITATANFMAVLTRAQTTGFGGGGAREHGTSSWSGCPADKTTSRWVTKHLFVVELAGLVSAISGVFTVLKCHFL